MGSCISSSKKSNLSKSNSKRQETHIYTNPDSARHLSQVLTRQPVLFPVQENPLYQSRLFRQKLNPNSEPSTT